MRILSKNFLIFVFLIPLILNHQIIFATESDSGDSFEHNKWGFFVNLIKDARKYMYLTTNTVLNPSLTAPFLWGPILPDIPHVRGSTPLGHYRFNHETALELSRTAHEAEGIVSFWMGPMPVIYIADNTARRQFVRQSHMGICDEDSAKYLHFMFNENNIMSTFPDFLPINSKRYTAQRKFLMHNFHSDLHNKLSKVEKDTLRYFVKVREKGLNKKEISLRKFVNLLILNNISNTLGLDEKTLDCYYLESEYYQSAFDEIAQYGISKNGDKIFEKKLYLIFESIMKDNFKTISELPEDKNLIKNIFTSFDVDFPEKIEDFQEVLRENRHNIAMNFWATGIGAMFHSTANTLDWALARLFNDTSKLQELVKLMENNKDSNLTDLGIFDQGGALFPVGEYIMHNVFINPPFAHEFFPVRQSYTVQWKGKEMVIPSGVLVIVNYLECNRSNQDTWDHFKLQKQLDVGKFSMNPENAAFGGSDLIRENNKSGKLPNKKSRRCPGAKFSLYEQMIMLAVLLRDHPTFTSKSEVSLDVDPFTFPIHSRKNIGNVMLDLPVN